MRWRLLVVEAALALALARLLVAWLPLGRWRGLLGPIAADPARGAGTAADWLLAKAVDRAVQRLPGGTKCLPRAIALFWMISRRKRPAQLVIAVLPGSARDEGDDLHVWVECGSEVMIGALDQPFRPLARFGRASGH